MKKSQLRQIIKEELSKLTEDNGYNRLAEYLQPLVDQEIIHSDIRDEILDLAQSYYVNG